MINIAMWEVTCNDDPFQSVGLSIYCAGCNKDCPGCHSPDLQDPKNGKSMKAEEVIQIIYNRLSLIESVIFLGGEWLLYPEGLRKVVYGAKKIYKLRTILYTGELFEDIPLEILWNLDLIIDGTYKEELKSNYKIPATTNQRVFQMLYYNDFALSYPFHIQIDPSTLPVNAEEGGT